MRCRLFFPVLVIVMLFTRVSGVGAQAASEFDNHPAVKVLKDYMNLVAQGQWDKSAALVEPDSLEVIKADYLRRMKNALTMDDEALMLKRVGKGTIEAVAAMPAQEFYTSVHKGMQERIQIPPEAQAEIKKTLQIRILSVAEEDPTHTHVLVRTKHSNTKNLIEKLELISLIKVGDGWKVGLNEMDPRIIPVKDAKIGGTAPPKNIDPVKPAPKPPKKNNK